MASTLVPPPLPPRSRSSSNATLLSPPSGSNFSRTSSISSTSTSTPTQEETGIATASGSSLVPPPLPPRNRSISNPYFHVSDTSLPLPESENAAIPPGSLPELLQPTDSISSNDSASTIDSNVEEELSEAQLRELYDNEEIERYLKTFSMYVTEVRLASHTPKDVGHEDIENLDHWTSIDEASHEIPTVAWGPELSLSEYLARRYVIPFLPPPRPQSSFTLGRLRLTTQRLYLSTVPVYLPLLSRLWKLAKWENKNISALYCAIYWFLWLQDILLPAFIFGIFFMLMKNHLFPYPSLDTLRRRRTEYKRADELGERIQERLSGETAFGVRDAWKLFRMLNNSPKPSKMRKNKSASHSMADLTKMVTSPSEQEETILDDPQGNSQQEEDLKLMVLDFMSGVADLHERVKNMFIWRRPAATRIYAAIIFSAFIFTLVAPAHYVAKAFYAGIGFLFWHIIPVIASIPSEERPRLPPPLGNVPTDAEYAMEVISQRVAAGLDVKPGSLGKKKHRRDVSASASSLNLAGDLGNTSKKGNGDVNWNKWANRVAEGKRVVTGAHWREHVDRGVNPVAALLPRTTSTRTLTTEKTHTFPAQHSSGPGLITLTQTTIFFTPIISQRPHVTIALSAVSGVKKIGLLKGLKLRYSEQEGASEESEVKFAWVGGRDELFARLVAIKKSGWQL